MHAIISIHPEHVLDIVDSVKTVEVRTKNVTLGAGSHLWIYSTLPVGEISAVAKVGATYRLAVERAWREFKHVMGLSRSDYLAYVNGNSLVSLISLNEVHVLKKPLSLASIRKAHPRFNPPQFLKRLQQRDGVYRLLSKSAPEIFK
jgi:predicted transcriptional regulator